MSVIILGFVGIGFCFFFFLIIGKGIDFLSFFGFSIFWVKFLVSLIL